MPQEANRRPQRPPRPGRKSLGDPVGPRLVPPSPGVRERGRCSRPIRFADHERAYRHRAIQWSRPGQWDGIPHAGWMRFRKNSCAKSLPTLPARPLRPFKNGQLPPWRRGTNAWRRVTSLEQRAMPLMHDRVPINVRPLLAPHFKMDNRITRRGTAANRALTSIALVRVLAGFAFVIVNLSAMGTALAQDRIWKECELAAHDPDRSIAACSTLLSRPSTRVHAAAFHNRGLAWAAKENLDQAVSDISQGIRLDPQRAYRWQERGE